MVELEFEWFAGVLASGFLEERMNPVTSHNRLEFDAKANSAPFTHYVIPQKRRGKDSLVLFST
jgi:hypothetical protein